MKSDNNNKIIKKDNYRRHKVLWTILRPIGCILSRIKLGYTFEKIPKIKEPFILLSNHVTDYDPILVGVSLPSQAYFVASEHITRWKVFSLLKFVFDPIIRIKGTIGMGAVKDILMKAKQGRNIAFFPEGVRSCDGITQEIVPATAKLVKKSGHALITYKIQGGYFTTPNWAKKGIRKGWMHGAPVRIYSSEELNRMSVDQVYDAICSDLYEDAYETQEIVNKRYRGVSLAEKLENLLFICPSCNSLHTLESSGDILKCTNCGLSVTYDEYGKLNGNVSDSFDTVTKWAQWQKKQVEALAGNKTQLAAKGILFNIQNGSQTEVYSGDIYFSEGILKIGSYEFCSKEIPEIEVHGNKDLVFASNKNYFELHIEQPGMAYAFLWFVREWNKMYNKETVI